MFKRILKILFYFILSILAIILLFFIYFNLPAETPDKNFEFGVTYSARYAEAIGLDKKETLAAILDDLKAKKIRIPVYWDLTEPRDGQYDFSEIDWQLEEAAKRNADAILIIGEKVPRWPECHTPEWARDEKWEVRSEKLLKYVAQIVKHYKNNSVVKYWQVENEPYLAFGDCPNYDSNIVDQEIALIRILDPSRKIIVTDSGELSLWIKAARRADIFGTTLYRSVVSNKLKIAFDYPIGPNFFKFKYWLIKTFAKQENIFICELQGEPWLRGRTTDFSLDEQLESMNAEKLRGNVEFAKKTGFSPIYLWGAEWWYWLKTKKDYPALWEEAILIFR